MVVTQTSDLDTQRLGSRSRMRHGMACWRGDGLRRLHQDARLVSPERWMRSLSNSPSPHVSAHWGCSLFQRRGCGTSETCRCGLSGQRRFPQVGSLDDGTRHNEHTRCPALSTTSRLNTTADALDQRLARGSVIGASGEGTSDGRSSAHARARKCGKHMGGEGLVCG